MPLRRGADQVEPTVARTRSPSRVVFNVKTPAGPSAIECDRIIARLGATPPRKLVESFGVAFPNNDPARCPSSRRRTNRTCKGLYIVGALGGYPLIKQAMNQGYEVVEYILGRTVEPADEPLLRAKFAGLRARARVDTMRWR